MFLDEPEEFTCCRCGEVKPFVQANCYFQDMFEPEKYFCDNCDSEEKDREERAKRKDV
jgi:hypothetical protein